MNKTIHLIVIVLLSAVSVQAFIIPSNPSFLSQSTLRLFDPSQAQKLHVAFSSQLAVTRSEEQVDLEDYEEDIGGEEEDIYEPCDKTFHDFQEQLEALAFLSSVDRYASQNAQKVFDEMYEAHVLEDNVDLWPNVTIYNLLIDAHAWSRDRKGGEAAQHILDRMEDETVQEIARPNVHTYIKVMEGWASRKQPVRAEQVFEQLQTRYQRIKSDNVRPNTGAYNKLIKSWMKSGTSVAGEKAEALLRDMLKKYNDGDEAVKPNRKTWVQVMKAYAERRDVESIEKIQDLLRDMARMYRMGDKEYRPDTQCYNVLVKAIGQNPSIHNGAAQAEELLYEMMEAFQDGNDGLRPNGATFVNVYNAFRTSNDPNAGTRAEKLLELQEGMSEGRDDDLKPDVRAYNAVITVVARSGDPKKAERAKRILDRMKKLQKGDKDVSPNLRTYNNILNACSYTKGEPKELMSAFRIAVDAINDLRESSSLTPDPVSYGLFLRCCTQLMPTSDKREAVVENIFRKCVNDGQVGSYVLHELSNAASPQLCRKLLGGDMEDGVNLPMEWSRNVKNNRQKLR
jgi:DNA-binding FadR family transcriptional regulator